MMNDSRNGEASIAPSTEPAPSDLSSVFALPEGDGYNDSERFLLRLCRRSFLSLWSYPNPYRAPAKELIDVLVIFGDDIILFSDKHIAFPDRAIDVSWSRWCGKAVDDSLRQLNRAKNWLIQHPGRVFQDAKATIPLAVPCPDPRKARYHLIATARGAFEACSRFFGDYGSLVLNTGITTPWDRQMPFVLGHVAHKGSFVHVFDEATIGLLLRELDTTSDFIQYLRCREEFLDAERVVLAHGEEQLLGAYLSNHDGKRHWFTPAHVWQHPPDVLSFDGTIAPNFFNSSQYNGKKAADKVSYFWDELIEVFIRTGHPAYAGEVADRNHFETALRTMASEPRLTRRVLSHSLKALLGVATNDRPPRMRFRTVTNSDEAGIAYVFLVFPKEELEDFDAYRHRRVQLLALYCDVLLAKKPEIDSVVGLAFDHPSRSYQISSEDCIFATQTGIDGSERERLLEIAKKMGIQGENVRYTPVSFTNYPKLTETVKAGTRQAKAADTKRKRKRKEVNASRKKNRRG